MPPKTRLQLTAGFAAFLGLCAGGVGCQTSSILTQGPGAHTGITSRSAVTTIHRAAAPDAGPSDATVIAASSPVAGPARPAATLAAPVSVWQGVQRVSVDKPAAPPTTGVARASINIPSPQPIAVAGAAAPNDPPTPLGPPRLEPQPAVIMDPPSLAPVIAPFHLEAPREFAKRPLPPYVVEPPDILLVAAGKSVTLEDRPIEGQHLVRPDGTIGLGVYGSVYVAGLTLEEVRDAVAAQIHLSVTGKSVEDIKKLLVADVLAYNSKVYYVITDGGGYGEQVYPIPITGNETVLDALSKINGLPPVASKKRIWVARATPTSCDHPEILPVDWCGITQRGCPATNYQIYPNDRVYVAADKWIVTDSWLAKRLNPIERILGATLLGSSTYNSIRNGNNSSTGR